MELVLFKDLIEEDAKPKFGVLNEENDYSYVICLECGGVFEFGDYEILKRLSWNDIKIVEKDEGVKLSDKYVVCMNEEYVRDAQFLDTKNLSEEEFENFDYQSCENERLWLDMEPNPFIAIVEAVSEEEACQKAAELKRYDSRCLYAIKI